jgi:beta-carotene hydroxylase
MTQEILRKPAIPREFYRPSRLGTAAFLAFAVAMYALPASLSVWLVRSDLPLALQIGGVLGLSIFTQQGIHLLAFVGHEGMHFSLARSKWVNAGFATFFSALVPAFVNMGATFSHIHHHLHTNRRQDPHVDMFPCHRSLWQRLFVARPRANRRFVREAIACVLGRPLPYPIKLPFTPVQIRAITALNLGLVAIFLALDAWLTWADPLAALVALWIPFGLAIVHSGLRIYVEHAGTQPGLFLDSRTYTHPFFTFMYFGGNYHLEHHLYPSVPLFRLPALHRHLRKSGCYDHPDCAVDAGFWSYWAPARGSVPYPEALADTELDESEERSAASQGRAAPASA